MVNKDLKFGVDARNSMLVGIEKLADAVGCTMGPRGKTVIIEGPEDSLALITKDGISVAKNVKFSNAYENLGAQMVKDVAHRTNLSAGDGTTTATIIAKTIYKEGLKHVASGCNPTLVKRGIDKAVIAVVDELKRISTPVKTKEEVKQVGTISANGDTEIGEFISSAMERVGNTGTITVEKGRGLETTLSVVEGMQFARGYLSSHFITNQATSEAVLIDPMILLYENKLNNIQALLPFLQRAGKSSKESGRPLLVIAESVEAEVISTLVVNKLRGSLNVCVVNSPAFGADKAAILEDLAALTGATLVGDTLGKKIENVDIPDLGRADKVTVSRDSTTIVGGRGSQEAIANRINHMQNQLNSDSGYDEVKLRERISKLSGGIAIITVGGVTEAEMHEKFHRTEDALNATHAAVAEGIVPGGGVALIRCLPALSSLNLAGDEAIGVDIIRRTLTAPLIQIINNAGLGRGTVVAEKILEMGVNEGYDALNDEYCNMIERGIIDPVKVCRCALQNAASIAGLLLVTECCITNAR